MDRVFYPDVRSRELIKIEVIIPYGRTDQGIERWYVRHDGKDVVRYLIQLKSDGRGDTFFATKLER